jgi:thiosulfate/3-mercaptopyruvate sulfurtransferase
MAVRENLVSIDRLAEHTDDPDVVIVDCRFTLGKPGLGLAEYLQDHIPGALYFDLEQDLSAPKAGSGHGGRHPLPAADALVELFSSAGIDRDVTVVAYDDQDMAMAARLWWLLRYMGHPRAAVLNGGYAAWRKAGLPVTSEVEKRTRRTFVPDVQSHMLVTAAEVASRSERTALLDSRAGERYRGELETIDPKAGHIPGALHYFYKENLSADGTLRPAHELKERFAPLAEADELIVYCGSGVTACVNLLALNEAGRSDAKLYLGSWSDWTSYPENPVATGEE